MKLLCVMAMVSADACASVGPEFASCGLPPPSAWREAALRHGDLFAPLESSARIGLLSRTHPSQMLVWQAGDAGIQVHVERFTGYTGADVDILLAADDTALREIRAAVDGRLFEVLRAGIRSGHIICYMLSRQCMLEALGCDELLEALGFAFMGACR